MFLSLAITFCILFNDYNIKYFQYKKFEILSKCKYKKFGTAGQNLRSRKLQ